MSGLTLPPQVTKTPIKRKLKVHSIETKYKALLDVESKAFPKGVVATKNSNFEMEIDVWKYGYVELISISLEFPHKSIILYIKSSVKADILPLKS